jgi:hypothetical protein
VRGLHKHSCCQHDRASTSSCQANGELPPGLDQCNPALQTELLRMAALCCSAALMLLVAVMEPDVGDSLPRIGDDHWFRFYMILGANGALAFLVRSLEHACRILLRDVPRQLHLALVLVGRVSRLSSEPLCHACAGQPDELPGDALHKRLDAPGEVYQASCRLPYNMIREQDPWCAAKIEPVHPCHHDICCPSGARQCQGRVCHWAVYHGFWQRLDHQQHRWVTGGGATSTVP